MPQDMRGVRFRRTPVPVVTHTSGSTEEFMDLYEALADSAVPVTMAPERAVKI